MGPPTKDPIAVSGDGAITAVTDMPGGGTLFEEFGVTYISPVDGHDMPALLSNLRAAKARSSGPVLINAVTIKGKEFAPAKFSADTYDGVAHFHVVSGTKVKSKSHAPSFTYAFGQTLLVEAGRDGRNVCMHP